MLFYRSFELNSNVFYLCLRYIAGSCKCKTCFVFMSDFLCGVMFVLCWVQNKKPCAIKIFLACLVRSNIKNVISPADQWSSHLQCVTCCSCSLLSVVFICYYVRCVHVFSFFSSLFCFVCTVAYSNRSGIP